MAKLPALAVTAVPRRRAQVLALAQEIENKGFAGLYTPSTLGGMAFCEALSVTTKRMPFGISIAPIYSRTVDDFAMSAAFMHEMSGGRFTLGIGISHGPSLQRMGVVPGKPLADIRDFVTKYKATEGYGDLAPVVLAGMRPKMIQLAGEIGDGLVFANAVRSAAKQSIGYLPASCQTDPNWYIGCMTPTCISDDVEAAKAVHRKTLWRYAQLPNYRNYWKSVGFEEEMAGVEKAIADGEPEKIPHFLTDRWLAETTMFGTASQVRDQVDAWYDAGVKTPILVPSSAAGNQLKAVQEVFEAYGV
jgi:alkanesulfonate monooxygenase SsuD/methylene tetrahydromethanopterin reductase-like flavin-dependent oxidoreductase (luciferase family)